MSQTFLKAEWRKLAMANYVVTPGLLKPYLPRHTQLDLWEGKCYVSLVGFMFLNTAIMGIKVPFHINFEEVNLRFYVRYKDGTEWKRGVVFIKEIVPKPALTFVANTVYKENYETMPMRHSWLMDEQQQTVVYEWKKSGKWNRFKVATALHATTIEEGSEAEFITEHYWGYTKIGTDKTSEYGVEHPRWQAYDVLHHEIDVDFETVYGKDFALLQDMVPLSVFLAEGSVIEVKAGRTLKCSQ